MLTGIEDRAFVTLIADLDEAATSTAQEIIADERRLPFGGTEDTLQDTLRILRRQDIADHGVLFR